MGLPRGTPARMWKATQNQMKTTANVVVRMCFVANVALADVLKYSCVISFSDQVFSVTLANLAHLPFEFQHRCRSTSVHRFEKLDNSNVFDKLAADEFPQVDRC